MFIPSSLPLPFSSSLLWLLLLLLLILLLYLNFILIIKLSCLNPWVFIFFPNSPPYLTGEWRLSKQVPEWYSVAS